MLDYFDKRLAVVERDLELMIAAPTFPIYDVADLPQDAIQGQIAIGTDHSINWFDGTSWQTHAGTVASVGNVPQDVVNGQVAIGSDDSLNWFIDGNWYNAAGTAVTGHPPQDAVNGQIAIGSVSIVWFSSDTWFGFA